MKAQMYNDFSKQAKVGVIISAFANKKQINT